MKIVINEIPPSNNKYMGKTYNYHQYQKEKERWHQLIKYAIKERPKKPIEKAVVNITYYFKDKRSRDPDNYSHPLPLPGGLVLAHERDFAVFQTGIPVGQNPPGW